MLIYMHEVRGQQQVDKFEGVELVTSIVLPLQVGEVWSSSFPLLPVATALTAA
jgi:hypothetical protein